MMTCKMNYRSWQNMENWTNKNTKYLVQLIAIHLNRPNLSRNNRSYFWHEFWPKTEFELLIQTTIENNYWSELSMIN